MLDRNLTGLHIPIFRKPQKIRPRWKERNVDAPPPMERSGIGGGWGVVQRLPKNEVPKRIVQFTSDGARILVSYRYGNLRSRRIGNDTFDAERRRALHRGDERAVPAAGAIDIDSIRRSGNS